MLDELRVLVGVSSVVVETVVDYAQSACGDTYRIEDKLTKPAAQLLEYIHVERAYSRGR